MARLCLERGEVDRDLVPLIAGQRAAIARQRDDLDRLDGELIDLEATIATASRTRGRRKDRPVSEAPIRVLFVCTGNSARSQIAEAVLKQLGGQDFAVFSAGTEPRDVNPYTVRVLADAGIDWSAARSKSIDEFVGQPFDYIITVCDRARQSCPIFPELTTPSTGVWKTPRRSRAPRQTDSAPSSGATWNSPSASASSPRSRCAPPVVAGGRRSPVEVAAPIPGYGRRYLGRQGDGLDRIW